MSEAAAMLTSGFLPEEKTGDATEDLEYVDLEGVEMVSQNSTTYDINTVTDTISKKILQLTLLQ